MVEDSKIKLDPIAFFDQLAANSSEKDQEKTPNKNLSNSYSLETVKPSKSDIEHDDFHEKWTKLIKNYKKEKQILIQYLRDQLIALEDVDNDFNKGNIELHDNIENKYNEISKNIFNIQQQLYIEKEQFENEKALLEEIEKLQEERIKLNVGGQLYETSLSTLRKDPNSMLAIMFNENGGTIIQDADNSYFIDRDGTYFRLILNYLRDLKLPSHIINDLKIMDELRQEAQFYKLNGLLKLCWSNLPVITQEKLYQLYPLQPSFNNGILCYKPVIMKFERKDLSGLDFSKYHIDPKSSFVNCNLQNCQFTNAQFSFDFDQQIDFSYSYLVGTKFPEEGTVNRSAGIQFKFENAILSEENMLY
ncbi:uncharacterized protein BX663DRAFT_497447 [Cokeromyces recurvatus]|uniref:uncharacterized protein n=1 Tax=Cokeromyces recurvatus TaxID=90255 RepID=UPI00221EA303|nr:uncharacterized protein BX663DRAFT_497447 [Cokeromyces recurvatus]KAI7906730.1 hypothetical protein BX663DRAFT_497447 [Cokeromyces recurvatus]